MSFGGNTAWVVDVLFKGNSNIPQILQQTKKASDDLSSSSKKASSQAIAGLKAQEDALKRVENAEKNLNTALQARAASLKLIAGVAIAAGTSLLIKGLKEGVDLAAKLQESMVAIGNTTGTSGAKLENIRRQIIQVSGNTAQDPTVIAAEYAKVAAGGFFNPDQLQKVMPSIAKFADVQMLNPNQHMDPVEAASLAVKLAHQYNAYDAGSVSKLLNMFNALAKTQPDSLTRLATQSKYYANQLVNAGIPIDRIIALTDVLSQGGFSKGRGSTGIQAFKTNSDLLAWGKLPGEYKNKAGAISDLDLNQYYAKNGKEFDPIKLSAWLAEERKKQGMTDSKFASDVGQVFGQTAAPFLKFLTTAQAQNLLKTDLKQVDKGNTAGNTLDDDQKKYMDTFFGAWRQFSTNFRHILIEVVYPVLGPMTAGLKMFANAFQTFALFLHDHQNIAKIVFGGWVVAIGAGIAAGAKLAIGLWKSVTGVSAASEELSLALAGLQGSIEKTALVTTASAEKQMLLPGMGAAEQLLLPGIEGAGAVAGVGAVAGAETVAGGGLMVALGAIAAPALAVAAVLGTVVGTFYLLNNHSKDLGATWAKLQDGLGGFLTNGVHKAGDAFHAVFNPSFWTSIPNAIGNFVKGVDKSTNDWRWQKRHEMEVGYNHQKTLDAFQTDAARKVFDLYNTAGNEHRYLVNQHLENARNPGSTSVTKQLPKFDEQVLIKAQEANAKGNLAMLAKYEQLVDPRYKAIIAAYLKQDKGNAQVTDALKYVATHPLKVNEVKGHISVTVTHQGNVTTTNLGTQVMDSIKNALHSVPNMPVNIWGGG